MTSDKYSDLLTPLYEFGSDLYYKIHATFLTTSAFHDPPPPSDANIISVCYLMPSVSSNLKGQFLLVEPFAVGVVDEEVERGVGAHKDVGEADYDVAGGERRNSTRDVLSGRQQSFVDMNL